MANTTELILHNHKIRVGEDGFLCLNDIHRAAGLRKNRQPAQWQRLPTTNPLIIATYERVVGKSHKGKFRTSLVYRTSKSDGTWAHPILAASYAGYLKPELEVEINEVWLRYKSGDATLADEVLERSDDAGNEWAAIRALGRVKRRKFTDSLNDHGVTGAGFGLCTNEVYKSLFDAPAKKLKEARGLPAKANLRDSMETDELIFVMAAETLSSERINEEHPQGNVPCAKATKRSSDFIRQAIEADRKDRQQSMI